MLDKDLRRMSNSVTSMAKWNDIQPMFRQITEVVMPIGGLFAAMFALARFGTWQTARLDFVADGYSGLGFVGIFLTIMFLDFLTVCFAFFCLGPLLCVSVMKQSSMWAIQIPSHGFFSLLRLCISFSRSLALVGVNIALVCGAKAFLTLLALCVYSFASLALIVPAKFTRLVSAKFVKSFRFLATRTCFGYDGLKHSFFLSKKLCPEPFAGTIPQVARFISAHHTRVTATNNNKMMKFGRF